MQLPFDLLSESYVKPKLFLCETDKTRICQLDAIELSGTFTFNTYAELNFTVGRTYINMTTGETEVNPFYDKIQALRLVYLEGFGYFEIQDPEIVSDGLREVKNVTAYGLEYTLSQKYIENLKVNTGDIDDVGVNSTEVTVITLYNPYSPQTSLLHLALEKIYGWSIGHVDASLATMSRTFDISRTSVYDFLIQDMCEQFNCFVVFNTIENTINVFAESLISKFIGDGKTKKFTVRPIYQQIGTVSVNGYKTTQYTYNNETGVLTLAEAPADEALVEVIDGSQQKWMTDVHITFDNLAQEVNVSYSADDIKTVLTIKGADDLDIREVNMGLPYLTDISYYCTPEWMGKELYKAYIAYTRKCENSREEYRNNSESAEELNQRIKYEENRLSLEYQPATDIKTPGVYYVRGGSYPNYYYTEVKLPEDFSAKVKQYYKLSGSVINEEKVGNLYEGLQQYFVSLDAKDISVLDKFKDDFAFVKNYKFSQLITDLTNAIDDTGKDACVNSFLDEMWQQLGQSPLEGVYLKTYTTVQTTAKAAGAYDEWKNDKTSEYNRRYHIATLFVNSLTNEVKARKATITEYDTQYKALMKTNSDIADSLLISNNFTKQQLVRLSAFLREDEYTDDNFIQTDLDTVETLMQTKQELLECGRIELQKLCQPKLSFSMDMANIYALPEFQPIIHQFQLGNLINVKLRDDYIKRARLLSVNFNFNDFTDFSCEFGEMTNLKTPSSIHADLLANALSAGKSVASKTSYLNKGVDLATATDLKIQQGLLGAIDGLYNKDQSVTINNNGILLRKADGTDFSPRQIHLNNNTILFTNDGWESAQIGIGEFDINGTTYYGVLAEAMKSGHIESSEIKGGTITGNTITGSTITGSTIEGNEISGGTIKGSTIEGNNITGGTIKGSEISGSTIDGSEITGGTIDIGNGAFIVDEDGNVTMKSDKNSIAGYATTAALQVTNKNIASKVSKGDFGTLVEQNYEHVKIAWNKNSDYIQFEDGTMNIYTSSTNNNNTRLMKMSSDGAWYYYQGTTVGKIGTNKWNTDTSYRGLVFDLTADASYMCWAAKNNASDTGYDVKLIYHHKDTIDKKGLHFLCNTYTDGHLYLTDNYRFVSYNDGSVGYNGPMTWVDGSNTACFRVNGLEQTTEVFGGSKFTIYNDVTVDIHSDIDMHNFDILNQSDARLKTNILNTQVNALSKINQIEMKEFDWIENGEHEEIGIIAQQLKNVIPELVYEDSMTGKLSIKMNKFIPYIIKAIQELSVDKSISTSSSNWADVYGTNDKNKFAQSIQTKNPIQLQEIQAKKALIPIKDAKEN